MQRNEGHLGYWGLSLIWPFLGFVLAIRSGLSKFTIPVILFFSFLYGYSVYIQGGDIVHYRDSFDDVSQYSWSDYLFLVTHSLDANKNANFSPNVAIQKPDIFALTAQFVVSRFTDNPRWFWGLLSVFYTYLIILFTKKVFKHLPFKRRYWHELVFIVALLTVIPFYVGVTGVRFWPALFVFMIFIVKYLETGSLKYILFSSLSVLIHYSFFFPVGLCVILALTNFNRGLVSSIVVVSMLIFLLSTTTGMFQFLQNWVTVFDDTSIEENIGGYVDEKIYQMRKDEASGRNWYVQLSADMVLYFFLVTAALDFFRISKLKETEMTKRIFALALIFFTLTLLSFNLGSIARFKNIFFLLMLFRYAILLNHDPVNGYLKGISYVLVPILTLFVLVSFRSGFYTVDPLLVIGNPITIFFAESSTSLSEFLVGH